MPRLSAIDRTQLLDEATAQFWKHIITIVQIAFAIHVLLFILFTAMNIPLLYFGNGLSIVAYMVCLRAIKRERYGFAGVLMCSEIILHAMLATWVLGWDSNFHFYLFCIVPIIAFSFQNAPRQHNALNVSIVVVAVGGFALRGHMSSDSHLSPDLLNAFGIINTLVAVSILLHATRLSVRYTLSMQYNLFDSANRDTLTQLYTRRRILDRVQQMARKTQTSPTALILLDVDHFKRINDRYGHDQGDIVLQRIAGALGRNIRALDLAARWGGEEFLILMPQTRLEEARGVAERILENIRESAGLAEPTPHTVTATLAVVEVQAEESFDHALLRADQALYLGKQQGRDRVVTA